MKREWRNEGLTPHCARTHVCEVANYLTAKAVDHTDKKHIAASTTLFYCSAMVLEGGRVSRFPRQPESRVSSLPSRWFFFDSKRMSQPPIRFFPAPSSSGTRIRRL
jgi:hypothetical protein